MKDWKVRQALTGSWHIYIDDISNPIGYFLCQEYAEAAAEAVNAKNKSANLLDIPPAE